MAYVQTYKNVSLVTMTVTKTPPVGTHWTRMSVSVIEVSVEMGRRHVSERKCLLRHGFVVQGKSPGCRLFGTASMLEWLRNLLPHHSQGSSTERWSRNTLRVVTARVFYILWGFLTSPFILDNSVEMAAPFNVVSHP